MIRINWTSVSLVALVVTVASLTPRAASGQTSPGPSSPASAPRVASAQGKEVRITAVDGSKGTGTLVSFSVSDVVFRQNGKDVSIPLGQVRKVEKVSHGVRKGVLIGGVSGVIGGTFIAFAYEYDSREAMARGLLWGAIGVGIGAGVGAMVDAAKADRNVIYQAPGMSSSVSVAPIFLPQRQGVALTMRW